MTVQTITTSAGEELVVLSRAEYDDLLDARDHAARMAAFRTGEDAGLTDAEMDAYLAAATPIAGRIGVSQPFLAQLENGRRGGDLSTYRRLAKELGVRIEDLLAD